MCIRYDVEGQRTRKAYLSCVVRKCAVCICDNRGADQPPSNRIADQNLRFRFIDSIIPLLSNKNFKPLVIFCGCTAGFVSALVGNPEDYFSHDMAHLLLFNAHEIIDNQTME